MILTDKQKSDIVRSWDFVAADPIQNMLVFYKKLFDEYPETKVYFHRVDMTKMSEKLAETINTLVAHVDNPVQLREVLEELGRLHTNLGIEPREYAFVKDALLITIKDAMGPLYEESITEAWAKYISFASAVMINAPLAAPKKPGAFMRFLRKFKIA